MAKTTVGFVGTPNTNYDLDQIKSDSRSNSSMTLIVQVWRWNPNLKQDTNDVHVYANPLKPAIGQIWLSCRESD